MIPSPDAPPWLRAVRAELDEAYDRIAQIVGRGRGVLVGCPAHANPGDSAIWIGQILMLRKILGDRLLVCSHTKLAPDLIARLPHAEITVLFHGGGNFGDLWRGHHDFRIALMTRFPELAYVQLPQSIWFRDQETLQRTRAALRRTRRFCLIAREQKSLEFARRELDTETLLSPDSAFALSPRRFETPIIEESIVIRRGDLESGDADPKPTPGAVEYLREPRMPLWPRAAGWIGRSQLLPTLLANRVSLPFGEKVPEGRYRHAIELLSGYRRVVTDFLHVHVLSCLLGIENVLVANAYHKNRSVWETWTRHAPNTAFLERWED